MAKQLDLDDVAAGNPKAEKELAELRAEVERLKESNDMHFQKYIKLKVNILKACDESRTR